MRPSLLSFSLALASLSLTNPVVAHRRPAERALQMRRHAHPIVTCPDGQYFNESACEPCLENYMCAFSEIFPCPPGSSSWSGASECTAALAGMHDAPSLFDSAFSGPGSSPSGSKSSSAITDVDADEEGLDFVDDDAEGEGGWAAPVPNRHRKDACFELGETQCPSPDGKGKVCVDPMTNLESCGGCSIPDEFGFAAGADCTAIDGAHEVSCIKGNCLITSCKRGYGVVQTSKGMQCVEKYDRILSKPKPKKKLVVQS